MLNYLKFRTMVRLIIYTFKILLFAAALGALGIHFLLAPLSQNSLIIVVGVFCLLAVLSFFKLSSATYEKS